MKMYLFSMIMNFVAAFVLFGVGALEINNLGTSIPAILCMIAGIGSAIRLYWNTKYPDNTAEKDDKG